MLSSLNKYKLPFNEDIVECFLHESEAVRNLFSSLDWYWLIQIKLVYFQILQTQSSDCLFEVGISYAVLNEKREIPFFFFFFQIRVILFSHYKREHVHYS